jgi:hypothetical protein
MVSGRIKRHDALDTGKTRPTTPLITVNSDGANASGAADPGEVAESSEHGL